MSRHNLRLASSDPDQSMKVHLACKVHRQVLKDFPGLRGRIPHVYFSACRQPMARYQIAFPYEEGVLYLDLEGGVALVVLGE